VSDPKAIARGHAHRDQIRALMFEHARRYPLARPLTGKQIAKHVELGLSTIYLYMDEIRREVTEPPSDAWNNSDGQAA
jgi:hypothetical protein